MDPSNVFGDVFRRSNSCMKQVHRSSLKWIWRKFWPCKRTFRVNRRAVQN